MLVALSLCCASSALGTPPVLRNASISPDGAFISCVIETRREDGNPAGEVGLFTIAGERVPLDPDAPPTSWYKTFPGWSNSGRMDLLYTYAVPDFENRPGQPLPAIWSIDPTARSASELLPGRDEMPLLPFRCAPSGNHVLYGCGNGLALLKADRQATEIFPCGGAYSWAPDGDSFWAVVGTGQKRDADGTYLRIINVTVADGVETDLADSRQPVQIAARPRPAGASPTRDMLAILEHVRPSDEPGAPPQRGLTIMPVYERFAEEPLRIRHTERPWPPGYWITPDPQHTLVWNPDGTKLAFVDQDRVWTWRILNDAIEPVTPEGVRATQPFWNPANGSLWFIANGTDIVKADGLVTVVSIANLDKDG